MLGLKLNHVSKRGYWTQTSFTVITPKTTTYASCMITMIGHSISYVVIASSYTLLSLSMAIYLRDIPYTLGPFTTGCVKLHYLTSKSAGLYKEVTWERPNASYCIVGFFLLNRMHAIAVRYYQNLVIFLSMRHLPSWSRFSPFNCGGLAHTTRVTARKTIYSLRNNLPGSCPARIHDKDLSQHQGFPFKEICNTYVRFSWNTARNPLKW